jgi:metal-sulfur cluster biosynthetic enzyme
MFSAMNGALLPDRVTDLLGKPTPGLVTGLLYDVIDPELGVNIVDLGLLRDVEVDAEGNVTVVMTLTAPGCPLGGYLEGEIEAAVRQLPAAREVRVELVWDPPWHPDQMTDAAREQLGWW